jgi:hypothetical protein
MSAENLMGAEVPLTDTAQAAPAPGAVAPDAAPAPAAATAPPSQGNGAAAARVTPLTFPAGAVVAPRARAIEDLFVGRFEEAMAEVRRVPHPIDQQLYAAGERDRIHVKRSRSDEVLDLLKRSRIYDRSLFDELPLDQVSEYRIVTRSFFGKKDVRVVVAAATVSPIEDFIQRRCSLAKSGLADLERALAAIGIRDESFYYLGVLSTVGWERGAERYIPSRPNVLLALVENRDGTEWVLRHNGDERWGGLSRLFDPESDREKVERARRRLETHRELSLRGGHVSLTSVRDELRISDGLLELAVDELIARDKDLTKQEVGGKWILKRRRL